MIISRKPLAFDYTIHWQDFAYFLGVYALGIYVGFDLKTHLKWIEKYFNQFVLVTIATTIILGVFYITDVNMLSFVSLRESLFFIQKLALAAVVIVIFKRKGDNQPKVFGSLANDAFAIYFMHFMVLFGTMGLLAPIIKYEPIYPVNIIVAILILTIASIAISKIIIFIFQKIFRRYSRMIIGS